MVISRKIGSGEKCTKHPISSNSYIQHWGNSDYIKLVIFSILPICQDISVTLDSCFNHFLIEVTLLHCSNAIFMAHKMKRTHV
jgi:hypothetical protein